MSQKSLTSKPQRRPQGAPTPHPAAKIVKKTGHLTSPRQVSDAECGCSTLGGRHDRF